MNKSEIREGNILLAKFMELKMINNTPANKFHYHSDWNWLMPVIEKLMKEYKLIGIQFSLEYISFGFIGATVRSKGDSILFNFWQNCVKAIKLLESQKQFLSTN